MQVSSIDWWLDLRFREKSFSGRVAIHFEDPRDPLTVDASHLVIESAALDGRTVPFLEDPSKGILEFRGISPGTHRLEISYHGAADPNSLVGLYVSPCGPGYCLTTMLFPTGSRRLLPSFEEPAVKTVYRLVLTTDADVKAIFNTAPLSERTVGDRREVTFEPTPPMSAYLLYLGVGPFETLTVPGTRWSVTVAASPGRASAGRYGAERATEILAAYEEYYRVPYPLPKLDLVALENFWAGAMENWGAIAFRESAVLVDSNTTVRERRVNLLVLAHEIAHQWFGNLVTPLEWNDFWLNESFATFVAHRLVDRRYPTEEPWTYFMTRYADLALREDARSSTHPVQVAVSSPDELGEVADEVTYGKGAAVLRMVEAYVGEESFRQGVSRYLERYRYQNARAQDLWTSLAEASDRPVSRVMTEWITRPGFPIVHAHWAKGTLTLRQERFRSDGAPSPGQWPIPLRVTSSSGEASVLFETPELSLPMRTPEGLRINPGRTAFARVHYDDGLLDQVVKEFRTMSPIDQWGVVSDAHAFVYAGLTTVSRFLEIVEAGTTVRGELPVLAMTNALMDLYHPLHDVPGFVSVAQKFLRSQLEAVGLERRAGEPDSQRFLRELLAWPLVRIDPEFAARLAPSFAEFDRLPSELRLAVATAHLGAGEPTAFEQLVARLRSTTVDAERAQLLRALGCLQDPVLLGRALDLIPSPGVTPSGALELFLGYSSNPWGGAEVFQWYQRRAPALSEMWAGTPILGMFFQLTLPSMGLDREEEVDRYFRSHVPLEARRGVEQGLEEMHLTMRLRTRELGSMTK